MAEPSTGKWFNLGGGAGAAAQPSASSRFPSMPNVNIPGFRREQVRLLLLRQTCTDVTCLSVSRVKFGLELAISCKHAEYECQLFPGFQGEIEPAGGRTRTATLHKS